MENTKNDGDLYYAIKIVVVPLEIILSTGQIFLTKKGSELLTLFKYFT